MLLIFIIEEKHDENIVYVRKLKIPKRALASMFEKICLFFHILEQCLHFLLIYFDVLFLVNNDNSVEAVIVEDNKCFKLDE